MGSGRFGFNDRGRVTQCILTQFQAIPPRKQAFRRDWFPPRGLFQVQIRSAPHARCGKAVWTCRAGKAMSGGRLDVPIVGAVPGVHKAVKWNSPFYGGWFLNFHCFTKYVKVALFCGIIGASCPPGRVQAQGRALPSHPRGRPVRRSAISRSGEVGRPIARGTNVRG